MYVKKVEGPGRPSRKSTPLTRHRLHAPRKMTDASRLGRTQCARGTADRRTHDLAGLIEISEPHHPSTPSHIHTFRQVFVIHFRSPHSVTRLSSRLAPSPERDTPGHTKTKPSRYTDDSSHLRRQPEAGSRPERKMQRLAQPRDHIWPTNARSSTYTLEPASSLARSFFSWT